MTQGKRDYHSLMACVWMLFLIWNVSRIVLFAIGSLDMNESGLAIRLPLIALNAYWFKQHYDSLYS